VSLWAKSSLLIWLAEIRSLFLNLKDKGNPGLRNEIVLGYISVGKLANMSKDVSGPV
jgi:hypothetical protein